MKKLFLVLSGLSLVGVSLIIPNFIDQTNDKSQLIGMQAIAKQTSIYNAKIDDFQPTRNAIVLRTDPINLTALGIRGNNGLNEYTNVELPEFQVKFFGLPEVYNSGYKWGAKMPEGEGELDIYELIWRVQHMVLQFPERIVCDMIKMVIII